MSTCYINCLFCNYEIGSAHEMVILREDGEGNITAAAHPECYRQEQEIQQEREMVWGGHNVLGRT